MPYRAGLTPRAVVKDTREKAPSKANSFAGCAAGTSYPWYGRHASSTGWASGSGARHVGSINADVTATVNFGVRCATAYTTGYALAVSAA